ncbi:MAG: hypothetical protein L6R19_05050 [Alphaproteobacteria bacterium]|nr:hypothetical protein [Alphaproteobacteria bacterium]
MIDTNVLLSGLLWRGPPHWLIEALRDGTPRLISSPAQIAEFGDVIHRPKFRLILDRSGWTAEELIAELRILAERLSRRGLHGVTFFQRPLSASDRST